MNKDMGINAKEYERVKLEGAREMIEKIIIDMMMGLDALDGDIEEAEPEKRDFYLEYQRGLRFAIIHIRRIAEDADINLLKTME